jgi:hypothetical protein
MNAIEILIGVGSVVVAVVAFWLAVPRRDG